MFHICCIANIEYSRYNVVYIKHILLFPLTNIYFIYATLPVIDWGSLADISGHIGKPKNVDAKCLVAIDSPMYHARNDMYFFA